MKENNIQAFYALVRAGLWEDEVRLLSYGAINYADILLLSEEQAVVGLVAAGLEHVIDIKAPQAIVLQFVGQTLQLEQRNQAMNSFISSLVDKLQKEGINVVLIKGQGIAQCYERPQWRSAGDIDLFLNEEDYVKTRKILSPLANNTEEEDVQRLHFGLTIGSWLIELHGSMRTDISKRINLIVDEVQSDVFFNDGVRVWKNNGVNIKLPNANNDIVIVFTHFVHHFYEGGIGVRQLCDWCRLMWTYNDCIDNELLRRRLEDMQLLSEWKAFASVAVNYLGMPKSIIPLYSDKEKWNRKAEILSSLIIEAGNLGNNKEGNSRLRYPRIINNFLVFLKRLAEFIKLSTVFPSNAPRFFVTYVINRVQNPRG